MNAMNMKGMGVLVAVGALALTTMPLTAQAASVGARLATLHDPVQNNTDGFGDSVSISGTTMVVGSPYNSLADVYTLSSGHWSTKPTVVLSEGNEDFGWHVAVSGNTMMIGAPGGAGVVYVYTKASSGLWRRTPSAAIACPVDCNGGNFGITFKLSGTSVVIGAYSEGVSSHEGAAYLYNESSGVWNLTATFLNPDPNTTDLYGFSVAMTTGVVVVGAPRTPSSSNSVPGPGAAYIYAEAAGIWPTSPTVTLADPGATSGDTFGYAVAASMTNVAVGAPGNGTITGQVYMYTANSSGAWPATPTAALTSPYQYTSFGTSLAISLAEVFVGQYCCSSTGVVTGYKAISGKWTTTPFVIIVGQYEDLGGIGFSLSLWRTTLAIGAPSQTSDPGYPPGLAYIYNV